MSKPRLVLDFDGVIHSYASGWKGIANIPDPPVRGAFKFLSDASQDFEIHILSSRSGDPKGRRAMMDWFQRHGWPGTLKGEGFEPEGIQFPDTKPDKTFLTIDDRCVLFAGEWPEPKRLLAYKSWVEASGVDKMKAQLTGRS